MTSILVTGASGFLGSYVIDEFRNSSGWKPVGLSRPCTPTLGVAEPQRELVYKSSAWPSVIADLKPDVVVHCAGAASVPGSLEEPFSDFLAGPHLTFTLLNAIRLFAPQCRFLFLSSAAVYGQPEKMPVCETEMPRPISPYGFHKLQTESICAEFTQVYGLRTAAARIFSAYGSGLKRQVVWDICRKASNSSQIALQGIGIESRDFVHASDVALAISIICDRAPMRGEVYNVASGNETRIGNLAKFIAKEIHGHEPEILFDGRASPGSPSRWQADISRIVKLGFAPKVSLPEGLRDLIASGGFRQTHDGSTRT